METLAVEAIRASQSATAAQTAGQAAAAGPSAPPGASAVAKFQAAMAADAPQGVSEIPFASQLSAAWRSAQANNQGMLHRIRALSELQGKHSLSAAELVELQYEVMNLSFQQEVVTKIADKSSNAVQTLIKNQ